MRQPLRTLCKTATVLSLVLCVGTSVAWVTTADHAKLVVYEGHRWATGVIADDAGLYGFYSGTLGNGGGWYAGSMTGPPAEESFGERVNRWIPVRRLSDGTIVIVVLSDGFVIAASGAFAAWSTYRLRTARGDRDARPCPTCGYDLRATPERCPECGTAVTT